MDEAVVCAKGRADKVEGENSTGGNKEINRPMDHKVNRQLCRHPRGASATHPLSATTSTSILLGLLTHMESSPVRSDGRCAVDLSHIVV